MSNFEFLRGEWQQIYESAMKAEAYAIPDPGTACFHARRTLELAMQWVFKSDTRLHAPYQQNLSALVHEPTFAQVAGVGIQTKARVIIEHGNRAVHADRRVVTQENALTTVRELFHVTFWMARTYARAAKPADNVQFLAMLLPSTSAESPATKAKLRELEEKLSSRDIQLEELIQGRTELDAELAKLRAEVSEARQRNAATPDTHDYSEEQTRDEFIDLLLREARWELNQPQDREYEVQGMPNNKGVGYVDYVLWGANGLPLAVVEAKRTRRSPLVGQHQAELYANCLEKKFTQRPVIFYTNGYEHWMWDDVHYPPRQVQGFYTRDELELLIQRRQSRQLAEHVLVDVALGVAVFHGNVREHVDHLGEQRGRGDGEAGVTHGVRKGGVAAHGAEEWKDVLGHVLVHDVGGVVLEVRPAVPLVGDALGVFALRKDAALKRLAGASGLVFGCGLNLVQALEEEEVGELLDDLDWVSDAPSPKGVPNTVDLITNISGKHCLPLSHLNRR